MIIFISFYTILFLFLCWHIYTGFCLWGFIRYKYRVALLKNGLYQPQSLETFGWKKALTCPDNGYKDELDAQAAIVIDIQWFKNKREKNRQSKIVKVIPFIGEKIK